MLFFGRKDRDKSQGETSGEQQVAPGTEIHYDGKLIDHFRDQHRALANLIIQIRDSARESRFEETEKYVNKFRLLLNEHLLEENLRLYTYLSYCLKGDPEGAELMRDMRREMGDIGRKVASFIKHHSEFGINDENKAKFLNELKQIVEALDDRLTREERSLNTLYLPPQTIQAGQRKVAPERQCDAGGGARLDPDARRKLRYRAGNLTSMQRQPTHRYLDGANRLPRARMPGPGTDATNSHNLTRDFPCD
jgi:regulator of sigma D